MARNGSGTWSAPTGQPVVAGTTISATAHNDLVTDIGTELTDSLSRSGKGPMLAAFKAVDGVVGGPGIAFNSEATSGIYRAGAGDVRFGILGALVARLTASGWFVNLVQAVTAVGISIKGSVTDGASAVGVIIDNTVSLANAGAKLVSFRNNGVEKAYVDKDGNYVSAAAGVTVTAGTGWTVSNSNLRKGNGIVAGSITLTAGASADFSAIATLPAGSHPAASVFCGGTVYDSSGTATYGGQFLVATTTGIVSLNSYDNGTAMVSPFTIGNNDSVTVHIAFGT